MAARNKNAMMDGWTRAVMSKPENRVSDGRVTLSPSNTGANDNAARLCQEHEKKPEAAVQKSAGAQSDWKDANKSRFNSLTNLCRDTFLRPDPVGAAERLQVELPKDIAANRRDAVQTRLAEIKNRDDNGCFQESGDVHETKRKAFSNGGDAPRLINSRSTASGRKRNDQSIGPEMDYKLGAPPQLSRLRSIDSSSGYPLGIDFTRKYHHAQLSESSSSSGTFSTADIKGISAQVRFVPVEAAAPVLSKTHATRCPRNVDAAPGATASRVTSVSKDAIVAPMFDAPALCPASVQNGKSDERNPGTVVSDTARDPSIARSESGKVTNWSDPDAGVVSSGAPKEVQRGYITLKLGSGSPGNNCVGQQPLAEITLEDMLEGSSKEETGGRDAMPQEKCTVIPGDGHHIQSNVDGLFTPSTAGTPEAQSTTPLSSGPEVMGCTSAVGATNRAHADCRENEATSADISGPPLQAFKRPLGHGSAACGENRMSSSCPSPVEDDECIEDSQASWSTTAAPCFISISA